jgi:hypothetical protein
VFSVLWRICSPHILWRLQVCSKHRPVPEEDRGLKARHVFWGRVWDSADTSEDALGVKAPKFPLTRNTGVHLRPCLRRHAACLLPRLPPALCWCRCRDGTRQCALSTILSNPEMHLDLSAEQLRGLLSAAIRAT